MVFRRGAPAPTRVAVVGLDRHEPPGPVTRQPGVPGGCGRAVGALAGRAGSGMRQGLLLLGRYRPPGPASGPANDRARRGGTGDIRTEEAPSATSRASTSRSVPV